MHSDPEAALATLMIHSDDALRQGTAVASELSLSTTFIHPTPSPGDPVDAYGLIDPTRHVYARYSQPTLARAEKLLQSLLGGPTVLFSSGLGAVMAALTYLKPKTIAITKGYHGVHSVIEVYQTLTDAKVIDLDDDYPEGTLAWLETPLNPVGEARDIQAYADKVHKVNGKLAVDATFAPPPLQAPFDHGADLIMHSATKYLFGHSDALGGVLTVRDEVERQKIWHVRTFGGASPGSLEIWLLLRSLRTLTVRVEKQARTATELALWFHAIASDKSSEGFDGCPPGVLSKVHHARIQALDSSAFNAFKGDKPQLKDGPACFSIVFSKARYAKWFPFKLNFFVTATSLGGVESLVEQRRVSDEHEDPCLVRLSIGLEDLEDLKRDIRQALHAVHKE